MLTWAAVPLRVYMQSNKLITTKTRLYSDYGNCNFNVSTRISYICPNQKISKIYLQRFRGICCLHLSCHTDTMELTFAMLITLKTSITTSLQSPCFSGQSSSPAAYRFHRDYFPHKKSPQKEFISIVQLLFQSFYELFIISIYKRVYNLIGGETNSSETDTKLCETKFIPLI